MIVKGFVFYKDGKIPFVIENYRMELFTDDPILSDFCKEYNFKDNYILSGQCFDDGILGRHATFLVENSIGSTCYLRCYIINMLDKDEEYDSISVQSPFLDDVFRYRYNFIDMARQGVIFFLEPKEIYKIPFPMQNRQYEASFCIGCNSRLGLLEDYEKKGEIIVPLHTKDIQECLDISTVLYRLAMFMASYADVPFKRIDLYHNGFKTGRFCCPLVSKDAASGVDILYYKLDVMRYIPKILENIALDPGNEITKSIPLGHLSNLESMFSPQRFIEQIVAFEYLFDKLDQKKAQDRNFPLKDELKEAFNLFPELLANTNQSADMIGENIKEIRRKITHGYAYYYDFNTDSNVKFYILLLDKLIRKMSLMQIGFTIDEIKHILII